MQETVWRFHSTFLLIADAMSTSHMRVMLIASHLADLPWHMP